MRSCDLVSAVTAISCAILRCFSKEELPVLAFIFNQLGDTLSTIIANDLVLTSVNPPIDSLSADDKSRTDNSACPDRLRLGRTDNQIQK